MSDQTEPFFGGRKGDDLFGSDSVKRPSQSGQSNFLSDLRTNPIALFYEIGPEKQLCQSTPLDLGVVPLPAHYV